MKAKKIRALSGFAGTAYLYELHTGQRVVASAANVPFSGPETLVFPADVNGKVTGWSEIGGGRGYMDCDRAIEEMEASGAAEWEV